MSTKATGVVLIASTVSLVLGALFAWQLSANNSYQRLEKRVNARLDSLEATVRVFEKHLAQLQERNALASDAAGSAFRTPSDRRAPDDLQQALARIEALESQLRWRTPADEPLEPVSRSALESPLRHLQQQIAARSPVNTVASRHAQDGASSDWGHTAASGITSTYADTPFFAQQGGELSTDCRRASCKAEWRAPDLSGLTEAEADAALTLARYELMAVIARGSPDVGLMETVTAFDQAGPRIEIYFEKD